MSLQRGAAIVESSLVMTVTLLLLFGSLSLGIIGYEQVAVDNAAYYSAHATATTLDYANKNPFETSKNKQIALSAAAAVVTSLFPFLQPSTSIKYVLPAMGGLGTNIDTASYYQDGTRHGGVTFVLPEGREIVISNQAQGIFGASNVTNVSGAAIDVSPDSLRIGYGSKGSSNNTPSLPIGKFFGSGIDTPPYFFERSWMNYCSDMVWSGTCPDLELEAIGSAEILDKHNWNLAAPTITGKNNIFSGMLCHQRVFAYAANYLFGSPTRPVYNPGVDAPAEHQYEETYAIPSGANWQQYPATLMYSWDLQFALGVNSESISDNIVLSRTTGCENVDF